MSDTHSANTVRVDKLGNSYYYFADNVAWAYVTYSGAGTTEIKTYPPEWHLEMHRDRFRYASHEMAVSIKLDRLTPDEFVLLQKILLKYGCIWDGGDMFSEHKTRRMLKKYSNKKMLICQEGKLSVVLPSKHRPESAISFTQAVYQTMCAVSRAAIVADSAIIRLKRPNI